MSNVAPLNLGRGNEGDVLSMKQGVMQWVRATRTFALGGCTSVNLSGTATEYMCPIGRIGATNAAEAVSTEIIMPFTATVNNLYVRLTTGPGGTTTRTFSLTRNTVPQSLSVTISGANTTGSDTTHSFPVVAGDTLCLRTTLTGAPALSSATGLSRQLLTRMMVTPY